MEWLAIAAGGALGALSRYGLVRLFPHVSGEFPWAIFIANVTGSVLVGVCYVLIIHKGLAPGYWRSFIIFGFIGALTTFSTFALDAYLLWQYGDITISIVYILSSVSVCLLAVIASIYLTHRIF